MTDASQELRTAYPEIEPYAHGMLDVGVGAGHSEPVDLRNGPVC